MVGASAELEARNAEFKISSPLFLFPAGPSLSLISEGRRIAPGASPGRKVRTPQGAMPRNPVFRPGYTREGLAKAVSTDSATENKPPV